jgi:hypothetical protein
VLGLATACEGLDDDHSATAAWARLWQSAGLIGFGGGIDIKLRCALRHGEQLASPSDIGNAVFAVGEQPVSATSSTGRDMAAGGYVGCRAFLLLVGFLRGCDSKSSGLSILAIIPVATRVYRAVASSLA